MVGKFDETTNLKATAVRSNVTVTLSLSAGAEASTEKDVKLNPRIRNCQKKYRRMLTVSQSIMCKEREGENLS